VFEHGPFEFFHFSRRTTDGVPALLCGYGGFRTLDQALTQAREQHGATGVVDFTRLVPELDTPKMRSMEF
jgi:hypothetical protein